VLALVVLEAVAVGLLGLLVAGLLRSHAEILRQLHRLGAGLDLEAPGGPIRPEGPQAVALRGRGTAPPAVGPLIGQTPAGEAVSVALDRAGERTLLLFLSSGCGTCAPWWEGLRGGAHGRVLPGVRVVVVARDRTEESPSLLAGMAPADVTVVLSSPAWEAFAVPGSPYAVMVDGSSASVLGEGVARSWEQLASLVGQHLGDLGLRFGSGPPPAAGRIGLDGAGRERRADDALLAAGILPGDPSLHPEPGSWSAGPA